MDRKGVWIVAAAIVLAAVIFGFSTAAAQRDFRTEPRPLDGAFPRYQVVNVTEGEVIIMDTTTGDLYSAKPNDVKPYAARPRPVNVFPKDGDVYKDKIKDSIFKDKESKDSFYKDKDKPPIYKDKELDYKDKFPVDKKDAYKKDAKE